jgi:hypothetical protein
MFLDPKQYGVVDVRVWKLLRDYGRPEVLARSPNDAFVSNRQGHEEWRNFVTLYRSLATKYERKARDVERCLWEYHILLSGS